MTHHGGNTGRRDRAFTLIELVFVIATIVAFSALLLPAVAKSQSQSHTTIDISNVRQILKAVHLYATDNSDFCPHPTWGTVPTGPTGWLYGSGMPSATAFSDAQVITALSNQMPYFRRGQLAPFLNYDQSLFECPTDVAMRRGGTYKSMYRQRAVKLSAYCFSGAISGLGAPRQAPNANNGGAYKLSEFRPTAFITWEDDETSSFNFNDGGSNQQNSSEGQSRRHTKAAGQPVSALGSSDGRVMVGKFGGEASFIKLKTFSILRGSLTENDLRCGPGYR